MADLKKKKGTRKFLNFEMGAVDGISRNRGGEVRLVSSHRDIRLNGTHDPTCVVAFVGERNIWKRGKISVSVFVRS